jgi:glycosyltransferase involved in cell wall biosynthesis
VVESLDRGAVENWLVDVFIESRKTNPDWQWTFYCMIGSPGRLDERVISNGGNILRSPVSISNKAAFLWHLRKAFTRQRYDILHVHHDFLSGFYLLAAAGIHFRKRILHVHNNDRILPVGSRILEKILLPIFRWISLKAVDKVLAISEHTLDDYRGSYRSGRPAFDVLYYGIGMDRFDKPVDSRMVRSGLGIPEGAFMLLYVGRMNRDKNPIFNLEILSCLLKRGSDVYLVLVGKGEKEKEILSRAEELRLTGRIRFLGWSDKVVEFMKSADAFVFPRLELPREGLGLVVVEAQCAGLPIFMTSGIVDDAVVLPELAHWNRPTDPDAWAVAIEDVLSAEPAMARTEALVRMQSSRFALPIATRNLLAQYA